MVKFHKSIGFPMLSRHTQYLFTDRTSCHMPAQRCNESKALYTRIQSISSIILMLIVTSAAKALTLTTIMSLIDRIKWRRSNLRSLCYTASYRSLRS